MLYLWIKRWRQRSRERKVERDALAAAYLLKFWSDRL